METKDIKDMEQAEELVQETTDNQETAETAQECSQDNAVDSSCGTSDDEAQEEMAQEQLDEEHEMMGKDKFFGKKARQRIEELETQLAKEKDDYIRLMAEFENYRRRSAAERLDLISTANEKLILEILPVIDDCERALKVLGESTDSAAAKEGTEMIYNKMLNVLKAKGLKKIEVADKPFDVEFMEAVAQFPAPEESKKGMVFDIIQNGYMLGEKVIRYAKVVVAQ